MRTIIAGSREITNRPALDRVMAGLDWTPTVVLSGGAHGVDEMGERWAAVHGIPVERYPADWRTHGRAAGPIRNVEMASRAQACVLLWDGRSSGTRHMFMTAARAGLRVILMRVGPGDSFELTEDREAAQ